MGHCWLLFTVTTRVIWVSCIYMLMNPDVKLDARARIVGSSWVPGSLEKTRLMCEGENITNSSSRLFRAVVQERTLFAIQSGLKGVVRKIEIQC